MRETRGKKTRQKRRTGLVAVFLLVALALQLLGGGLAVFAEEEPATSEPPQAASEVSSLQEQQQEDATACEACGQTGGAHLETCTANAAATQETPPSETEAETEEEETELPAVLQDPEEDTAMSPMGDFNVMSAPSAIAVSEFKINGATADPTYSTAKYTAQALHLELKIARRVGDTTGSAVVVQFPIGGTDYFDYAHYSFPGLSEISGIFDTNASNYNSSTRTLKIPVLNNSLNDAVLKIDVPFFKDTYGGMMAPGVEMATIEVYPLAAGDTTPEGGTSKTLTVKSTVTDPRKWGGLTGKPDIQKDPLGVIVPGEAVYTFTSVFNYNARQDIWFYKAGSTVTIKMYVPEGTTIVNPATGGRRPATVNASPIAGQDTYLYQDMDGYYYLWELPSDVTTANGWYSGGDLGYFRMDTRLKFSSTLTGNVKIKLVAQYYLEGDADLHTKTTEDIFTLASNLYGEMTSDGIVRNVFSHEVAPGGVWPVYYRASSSNSNAWTNNTNMQFYQRFKDVMLNVGRGNLTNVAATIQNDGGVFQRLVVARTGVLTYPVECVVALVGGASYTVPLTAIDSAGNSGIPEINGKAIWKYGNVEDPDHLPAIDTIVFKPKTMDGSTYALLPGAGMHIQLYQCGNFNAPDVAPRSITCDVTWDGQLPSETPRQSAMAFQYTDAILDLSSSVSNKTTGAILPGETVKLRVTTVNDITPSDAYGVPWKKPVFYIVVPSELNWIDGQAPSLHWQRDGGILASAPVSVADTGQTYNGRKIYRIEYDCSASPIYQTTDTSGPGDRYVYFDLDFAVPAGTPKGNIVIKDFAIATEGAGNLNNYTTANLLESVRFDDSVLNLDGNTATSLLRKATNITITVSESTALTALANLEDEDGVMHRNGSGVYTALKVGDTGHIQLVVENKGNVAIEDFRLYNLLPDQTVTAPLYGSGTLDSKWDGYFASNLTVKVANNQGNPISGITPRLNYSDSTTPLVDHLNLSVPGTNDWSLSPNFATNRAFYMDLNGAELPAGAKITIDFEVTSPATANAANLDTSAFNTFVALGKYKGGSAFTPFADTQKFTIFAATDGVIAGNIFKDIDGDGVKDPGEDGWQHAGLVELYKESGGSYALYRAAKATDANGNYSFTGLPAGDYKVKFLKPAGFSDITYNPAEETAAITLNASGTGVDQVYGIDAGASRPGTITVYFSNGSRNIGGSVVLINKAMAVPHTVTAGTDVSIPSNFSLRSNPPESGTRTVSITNWDDPRATVTFYLEYTGPYKLQVVSPLVLDVNDKYPSFVSHALTWEQFLPLLEAKTLDVDGNVLEGVVFNTLTSGDYAAMSYDVITLDGPMQTVTVRATWDGGRSDTATVQVRVVDRVRPVITVPEERRFQYPLDQAHPESQAALLADFEARGVSWLDNYDGVTPLVLSYPDISGFSQIDWTKDSEYIVFLDTKDQSGNVALRQAVVLVIGEGKTGGGNNSNNEGGSGNNGDGGNGTPAGTDAGSATRLPKTGGFPTLFILIGGVLLAATGFGLRFAGRAGKKARRQ